MSVENVKSFTSLTNNWTGTQSFAAVPTSPDITENSAGDSVVNKNYVDAVVEKLKAQIKATQTPLLSYVWSDYDFTGTYDNWVVSDGSFKTSTRYPEAFNHLTEDIQGKTLVSETVESDTTSGTTYTVQYYQADDGHKIAPYKVGGTYQTDVLNAMYTDNGVAWYYVYDANTGFILPRASGAERRFVPKNSVVPVYGNGLGLGFTDGTHSSTLTYESDIAMAPYGKFGSSIGTWKVGDSSMSKSVTLGVTEDSDMSGLVARVDTTETTVSRKSMLAFYVT